MDKRVKVGLLLAVTALIFVLVIAGVIRNNINITTVALALVSLLGWITKSILGNDQTPNPPGDNE